MVYDLLVIGGGSGGVRAARLAAEKGLNVAIVEKRHWGGTCVNLGCIPKKFMVLAAQFAKALPVAPSYGWRIKQPDHHWKILHANIQKETQRLAGMYKKRLADLGVKTVQGEAQFLSAKEVCVDEAIYQAKTILIATGSHPFIPAIPGKELALVSDDLFGLAAVPRSIIIIGGGYIALEFASILSALGVDVRLIYRAERPLKNFDAQLAAFLAHNLCVQQHPNTEVVAIRHHAQKRVSVQIRRIADQKTPAKSEELTADSVLFAAGRVANTQGLMVERAGISLTPSGAIAINTKFQSSVPHIFALGDVTETLRLTPVAIAEAEIFVKQRFEGQALSAKDLYTTTPSAVFCDPEIATIGLSQEQAEKQFGKENTVTLVKIVTPLKYSLMNSKKKAFIKIVYHQGNANVLGIHLACEHAAEIMQGFAVSYRRGVTLADLRATMAIHPTFAEELVTS